MSEASPADLRLFGDELLTMRGGPSTETIPSVMHPILGREDELTRMLELLGSDGVRLLTLTGPGGVGKTRLAIELARIAGPEFAHGASFVSLSSIRDHTVVPAAVARSLGIVENPFLPVGDQLVAWVRSWHMLLVLDGLEYLSGYIAPWLLDLLHQCPRLSVVVTSRSALHLSNEQRFLVSPLPVVDTGPGEVPSSPAILLFQQRAMSIRPEFDCSPETTRIVGDICHRLNGLPLAIELAAAWVNVLSVDEILARLTDQLSLLSRGRRDAVPRLQSMRSAIAWSYELLAPAERELFRRLSVFSGGFTLEAAEDVCDAGSTPVPGTEGAPGAHPPTTIGLIGALVDQSLLTLEESPTGDSRYVMLDTVHTFAREQLFASGRSGAMEQRHAAWCLQLAEQAETRLLREVDASWLDKVETEHDNIRAALEWALGPGHDDAEFALRIAGSLWLFWYYHSHLFEGRRWLERALQRSGPNASTYKARALVGLGTMAHCQGDDAHALECLVQSVGIFRMLQDPWGTAFALSVTGNVSEDRGDYEDARTLFTEANTLFNETGDSINVAVTLNHLGVVAYGTGELDEAWDLSETALQVARGQGDPWTVANALSCLGLIRIERAEVQQAADALAEALALYRQIASTERIVDLLQRIAVYAEFRHEPVVAVRLTAAARRLGSEIGAVFALPERATYDRALAACRKALPATDFEAAWVSGERLGLTDAIAAANACLGSADPLVPGAGEGPEVAPAKAENTGLSARELEVLRLMADGMSNQQIADALFVSQRTVSNHVSSILSKLQFASRTAAVAYAIRSGIA